MKSVSNSIVLIDRIRDTFHIFPLEVSITTTLYGLTYLSLSNKLKHP